MEVIKGMKDTEKGSKEVTGMEEEKVKNRIDEFLLPAIKSGAASGRY